MCVCLLSLGCSVAVTALGDTCVCACCLWGVQCGSGCLGGHLCRGLVCACCLWDLHCGNDCLGVACVSVCLLSLGRSDCLGGHLCVCVRVVSVWGVQCGSGYLREHLCVCVLVVFWV